MLNRRGRWWARGRSAGIAAVVVAAMGGGFVSTRPCGAGEPAVAAAAGGGSGRGTSSRGLALFVGAEPLTARIRGHQSDLPPEVVRCQTCHGDGARPASPNQGAPPRLDRSLLLWPQARRGGPPSSYDLASFCRMLRTGADPAYVLVAREMPTYDLDEGACAALWGFLTAPTGPNGSGGAPVPAGRAASQTRSRAEAKAADARR